MLFIARWMAHNHASVAWPTQQRSSPLSAYQHIDTLATSVTRHTGVVTSYLNPVSRLDAGDSTARRGGFPPLPPARFSPILSLILHLHECSFRLEPRSDLRC
eukprot:scaffold232944_cov37-Tisochrysis_lutea.AAC.2